VTSSVLLKTFYGLSSNIERLSYATYAAETAAALSPAPEDAKIVIPLLLNTLYLFSDSQKSLRLIKCVYELRLLCHLGYSPELDSCLSCGEVHELCAFSASEGGILCRSCLDVEDALLLSPDTIDALRYVKDADDKKAFSFALSNTKIDEFERCTEKMLEGILGKRLPSLNYLKQIAGRI